MDSREGHFRKLLGISRPDALIWLESTKPGKWMMVIGWSNSPPINLLGVLGARNQSAIPASFFNASIPCFQFVVYVNVYVRVSMVVIRPLLAGYPSLQELSAEQRRNGTGVKMSFDSSTYPLSFRGASERR